jgi:putative membrane protein (TIGR04086 family)
MREFCERIILSICITILLIFIFSLLLSFTNLSEEMINPILIGINSISIMISSFSLAKTKREKGIMWGLIFGCVYMIGLYLISGIVNFDFSLKLISIIMIILGIACGGIGGVVGVNL